MPLFLDTGRTFSELNAANCVTIGLVNNMPDTAFEATERQFVELIREAAPERVVLLKLFVIPEVPRGEGTRRALAGKYRDIAQLWDTPLDGLIVTGTEPRAKNLKDEPYWESLSAAVDWARDHTSSTIWSCLAAHAAVLHSDGIERRALPEKQFGVFDCRLAADHPMTQHFPEPLWVPHSRYNDLPEEALVSSGYKILTRSAVAGVDAFAKQDGSFFLYFQGHPEYDADTLFREYRRDVARFLGRERETYPALPQNYFDDVATALAEAFAERAIADRRGERVHSELMADFPKTALETGLQNSWRPAALGVYEKWVEFLSARKAERRTVSVAIKPPRLRRTWRDWPLPLGRPAGRSAR
jgi:homoserine O-succinyltransferase/O-acetyltransferase